MFFEVEFPRTLAFKSGGGPNFSTVVNEGFSGAEFRNRNWAFARAEYTLNLTTPAPFDSTRQAFIDAILAFFYNVGGQGDSFRFFDYFDHIATNQPLATIGGNVQCVKNYVTASRTYQRVITKPIGPGITDYKGASLANTVFLHGTTTPVTVDSTTGIVTGESAGTAVDFQFHVPTRFAADLFPLIAEPSNFRGGRGIVSLSSAKLKETRPPNY
jgi:uncharacterized protein (TIGR02217 family)